MPGSEIPDLQGVFRFVSRLHTMSKRGMRGALADCPRCHFGMLENLHILIEQRGVEGAIYVSEVARAMRQPMPAVSRGLRMMEQDGSIVRETDPNDRRKTFVRITPQGEQARLQSEAALNAYFGRIMARMTPEQIDQMYALRGVLLVAIEAENDAMQKKISAQKQGGPAGLHKQDRGCWHPAGRYRKPGTVYRPRYYPAGIGTADDRGRGRPGRPVVQRA